MTKESSRKRISEEPTKNSNDSLLFEKVIKIDCMLERLCKEKAKEVTLPDSFINKEGELKNFPIIEIEKIKEIEVKLRSTNLFDKLVSSLFSIFRLKY